MSRLKISTGEKSVFEDSVQYKDADLISSSTYRYCIFRRDNRKL